MNLDVEAVTELANKLIDKDNKIKELQKKLERAVGAFQKTKCANGFYPGCIETEKEREKLRPYVIQDVITPCPRCAFLASLESKVGQ